MGTARSVEIPGAVRDAVLDLRARLGARFGERLRDFLLFGSYARGDWGPDSDVDVLVVVAELKERERREIFELAEEVFFDRLIHLSPLAFSTAEYEELRSREYRLAAEIEADGVVP
ncbi:MAG: nucleotidyltransferase domain-containing protein [Myxococcales bacterium]|nr:nucleotidyltransferase domain-containing protein [Myxococcales bacterium]